MPITRNVPIIGKKVLSNWTDDTAFPKVKWTGSVTIPKGTVSSPQTVDISGSGITPGDLIYVCIAYNSTGSIVVPTISGGTFSASSYGPSTSTNYMYWAYVKYTAGMGTTITVGNYGGANYQAVAAVMILTNTTGTVSSPTVAQNWGGTATGAFYSNITTNSPTTYGPGATIILVTRGNAYTGSPLPSPGDTTISLGASNTVTNMKTPTKAFAYATADGYISIEAFLTYTSNGAGASYYTLSSATSANMWAATSGGTNFGVQAAGLPAVNANTLGPGPWVQLFDNVPFTVQRALFDVSLPMNATANVYSIMYDVGYGPAGAEAVALRGLRATMQGYSTYGGGSQAAGLHTETPLYVPANNRIAVRAWDSGAFSGGTGTYAFLTTAVAGTNTFVQATLLG